MIRGILLFLFTIFFSALPAFSQENKANDEDKVNLYLSKIRSYQKMKRAGWILAGTGAAATGAGVLLVTDNSSDSVMGLGYLAGGVLIVAGVPLAVTGLILGTIGTYKMNTYSQKLQGFSFNIHMTPIENSLGIRYTF